MIRALMRIARALPREIDRLWLLWGLASLTRHAPMHPDIPSIVLRIRELEGCAAIERNKA